MSSTHTFTRRAAWAATALAALLLAGCGMHRYHHPGPYGMGPHGMDPANPMVWVDAKGRLSVSPEPLRFDKARGEVTITWRLPPDGRYSFAKDGIVVEGQGSAEEFRCGPGNKPYEYQCLNRNTRGGDYKYTVRAQQDGKPLQPLDPRIVNDW